MKTVIKVEMIEQKIYLVRGRKVMFDSDLAKLYEVETKYLTRQVRRNIRRFPTDFMFHMTAEEYLRCQNVTSKRGGRRYLPYVFTELGIAMLSTVLNSERAIEVNMAIMRVFVKLREVLAQHKELVDRLKELENRMDKKDQEILAIFEAIRKLMTVPPVKKKAFIGFHPSDNSI